MVIVRSSIKVAKTYPSRRVPDRLEYTQGLIDSCTKYATKLVGLSITPPIWQGQKDTCETAYLLSQKGDRTQTPVYQEAMLVLESTYKIVATFVEVKCNEQKSSSLAVDMNMRLHKVKVRKVKSETSAKNTTDPGVLEIDVIPKKGAVVYNVERTKVTVTGTDVPELIESLTSKTGFRGGFDRFAEYLIRTRPVFKNDTKGEWSAYFLITIT